MLAHVERGHSLTMFVVRITVCPIMNQSPVLAAARVAVDLLPRQCASLVLCVRSQSRSMVFTFILESDLCWEQGENNLQSDQMKLGTIV